MGAVGSHQQAQAQADYQNEVSRRNYEHAVKTREAEWQGQLSIWNNKKVDFQNQLDSNYAAADRAYAAEQSRLNEGFMQAAFQKQDMLAQLMQGRGDIAASGRSGKSVAKMDQAMLAAFGRNNAIISENLRSARSGMIQRNEQTRLQLQSGNNQAWSSVGMAPIPGVAPLAPTMVAGPSGIGLASGILGGVASGLSTLGNLKAPDAGSGDTSKYNFNPGPTDSKHYGPAFGNNYVPYTSKPSYKWW